MTCVDLNDIAEEHLGNNHNVGIYQNTFGDQAEAACQNDHRDDVRGVFAWAFDDSASPFNAVGPGVVLAAGRSWPLLSRMAGPDRTGPGTRRRGR